MFAPIEKEKPKGRRMEDDDGLVFVSKEERERRRLKKEERDKEAQKIALNA